MDHRSVWPSSMLWEVKIGKRGTLLFPKNPKRFQLALPAPSHLQNSVCSINDGKTESINRMQILGHN